MPQHAESLEFAREDLRKGGLSGVYKVVSEAERVEALGKGHLISSALTLFQGDGEERKGRFVVNFSKQSKFWSRKPLKMKKPAEFASELKKGDRMISFDLAAGYRHVHLHSSMCDHFLFCYEGVTYRCLSLPFGWGGSAYHFSRLMPALPRSPSK